MKNQVISEYLIVNSEIIEAQGFDLAEYTKGNSIYEVIRIINGIPLYLEEHIARLRKSENLLGVTLNKTNQELMHEVKQVIKKNNIHNQNIKIICSNLEEKEQHILLFGINSYYPPKLVYQKGIKTILYRAIRHNPNIKANNINQRQMINQELKNKNVFEALLVNDANQITEGSRSNLFFVKGDKIFTSPADKVLQGITRMKLLEVCNLNNIEVIEKNIEVDSLNDYEGAFLTGTSINVLPIQKIDGIFFNSSRNSVIVKLMQKLEKETIHNLETKKNFALGS